MIPIDFDNLLANRDMRGFQVRLSSKKTPKNMVSETLRIGCSFMETWNSNDSVFCQGLRADVSKYRPEVYKSEESKILKKIHKVALGKLLT